MMIGINKISYNSTLVLEGEVYMENFELDGSIRVSSTHKEEMTDLQILDKNYVEFVEIDENETDPHLKMRGYKTKGKEDIIEIVFA